MWAGVPASGVDLHAIVCFGVHARWCGVGGQVCGLNYLPEVHMGSTCVGWIANQLCGLEEPPAVWTGVPVVRRGVLA